MKKLNVNEDACIGCGACISIDPEHFDFNDDGLSTVISQDNMDSEDACNAIESCPTNAIKYIEENNNCNCKDCDCQTSECNCCN